MDKHKIAEVLEEIAVLLELQGANPFRIRAYRNAARSLLNTDRNLKDLIQEKKLTDLEGIGKDLAEKIALLATKKRIPFYEKLKKSIPQGILKLIQIPGLGPKKVKMLYQKLRIQSIKDLKKACLAGKIAKLKGFGKKTEQNILDAIGHREVYQKRHLWWDAMHTAGPILESLKQLKQVKEAEIAGSLRRKLETIGDLDFLAGGHALEVGGGDDQLEVLQRAQADRATIGHGVNDFTKRQTCTVDVLGRVIHVLSVDKHADTLIWSFNHRKV